MTKFEVWEQEPTKKTTVSDVISIVKTEEQTDSVQLKKEAQLNICERKLLDMEEDRDYYKTKSASLEEGYIKLQKENRQLKLLVQGWEALDEEKDEQLDKQNQALKKLKEENEQFYNIANDYNIPFDKLCETFEQCLDENEQLKKQLADVDRLIDDLGHDEMRRQYEEIFER